jgi:hypothetical protein
MDPNTQQPTPQPPVDVPAPAAAPADVNPGKTLGIVGFILAFLVALAGLIVSIIALSKSKKAGFKNGLALAGVIIAAANIVLSTIGFIALVTLAAYSGVTTHAYVEKACSDQGNPQMVTYNGDMYDCTTHEIMSSSMTTN